MRAALPVHHRPHYIGSSTVEQEQLKARFDAILPENSIVPYVDTWWDVAYSPDLDLYIAIDEDGVYDELTDTASIAMTSKDGRTWARRTTPAWYADAGRLCWSPELALFIYVGYVETSAGGEYQGMTSPDGIIWTLGAVTAGAFSPTGLAWSPTIEKFFAVDGTNVVRSSADGITWATAATLPSGTVLNDIIWTDIRGDGGSFCAAGAQQVMSSSGMLFGSDPETGTIWSALYEGFFEGNLTGLSENVEAEVIIAVGAANILAYAYASKPAAATFTLQTYPVGYPPAGSPRVAWSWAMEAWLITGLDRFLVSYAHDGTIWAKDTPNIPGVGGDFRSVCAGKDVFLACGLDAGVGAPGVVASI